MGEELRLSYREPLLAHCLPRSSLQRSTLTGFPRHPDGEKARAWGGLQERGQPVRPFKHTGSALICGAMIMIETEWPEVANRAPAPDGSSPVVLYVYVEDVDRTVERAVAAGARIAMPLTNQFWGDRTAWIVDPSGHVWTLATRIEETTEEERQARLARILAAKTSEQA